MRRKIQAKFNKIKILTFITLVCSCMLVSQTLATTSASSWLDGEPTVTSEKHDVDPYRGLCQQSYVYLKNNNYSTPEYRYECIYKGKDLEMFSWRGDYTYIRFKNSKYFNRIETYAGRVKLIPGTNTLIAYNYNNFGATSVSIYKNIFDAIVHNPSAGVTTSGPSYLLKTSIAKQLYPRQDITESSGYVLENEMSSDGKTIFMYVDRRLYIKINLETGTTKVFDVQKSVPYWQGGGRDILDANTISSDGRYVYAGRLGKLIDTDNCGDTLTKDHFKDLSVVPAINNPCKSRDVSSRDILRVTNNDYSAYVAGAAFAESDNVLNLDLYSDLSPSFRVKIQKPGYAASTSLKYLALGDSISSGEGDTALNPLTGKKYYRAYTDAEEDKVKSQPREKCHLSTRSYPYLLAGWMKLKMDSPKEWNSVACSGATTTDIYGDNNSTYMGQKKDEKTPRLEGYTYATSLKDIALNEMIPGRNLQVEFVKKHKPKVITLTGGANDIDFSGKIKSCLLPLTCSWAKNQKNNLGNQIKDQYEGLVKTYKRLKDVSENKTKIYALSYPLLISDAVPGYCGWNIQLNNNERKMVVQATKYMNQVIKAAAQSAGVAYIDIENSLVGGRLCDDGQRYVTGIAAWDKSENQESIHPNDYGQVKIAQAVKKAVNNTNLINYNNCPNITENTCPNDSITAPPLPPEFGTEEKNVKEQRVITSTLLKTTPSKVSIPNYSLEPNSKLKATLHSDPISLGTIGVAGNGGVWADIKLPANTPPGYHTLVLEGKTYSGEPITITQSVVVLGTNETDRDENGVEDTKQPCGLFMTASGKDADLDGIDDACDPQIDSTPQLYRIRVGDPARSYAGAPEKPNYIYVERNTRASAITKVSGDYDPDGDGWAIVGASSGIAYSETTMPDTAPAANVRIVTMNNVPTPYVYFRDGRHGCVSYTPETLAVVKSGEVRKFKLGSKNNAYCRSAAPTEDMDSNNLPDNTQPLYTARKGDTTKNEDPNRLYLLRSFHAAEAQLGISDYNYGGTPAINPNLPINEWTIMATTNYPITYNYNKLVILKDSAGKPLPTLLTKNKTTNQCIAYQPANTLGITEKTLTTRWLNKLSTLPSGISCN